MITFRKKLLEEQRTAIYGVSAELDSESFNDDQRRLIQAGLERIDQGLSIFSMDLTLVAANTLFNELLDLPAEFGAPGTSIADIFRYNARRGEYGEGDIEELVEQRLQQAYRMQAHRFKRTRPDGTVLEICGTPIPGFGFVTTYTDITERIRSAESLALSRRRFLDMALAASDWFWELNADLRFSYVSERFYTATGVAAEAILGRTRIEIADPANVEEERENWKEYQRKLDARESFRDFEYRFIAKHKGALYLKVSGVPVFGEDGSFQGYRGTGTDITELRLAQEALAENERRLRVILDSSVAGVAIASVLDGSILFANPRLSEMFQLAIEDLDGMQLDQLCADQAEWELIRNRFEREGQVVDAEVAFSRGDGGGFWGLISLKTIQYQNQAAVLTWFHDVSELRESREKLKQMALSDPLTGLANRRLFKSEVGRALARANRSGQGGSMLYFDLDGFKPVNDTYGHDVGDYVLCEVATRIKAILRSSDLLSRLGGDEFAVLLENTSTLEQAVRIGEKIVETIQQSFTARQQSFSISASVGVAFFEATDADPDALLIKADRAMYEAKCTGKARVCVMHA